MCEEILNIRNLSCGYNRGFVISDINISIKRGDFVGILGRNGSGKTSLLRGIMSEMPVINGEAYLNGKSIYNTSIKERAKKIAVVSQFYDMYDMTVGDFVLMGRVPHKREFQFFDSTKDISIAEYYMKMTNTYKIKDKNVLELSGGEQQMVCIASALTQQPELILLDEPTSHLDITHQLELMNILKSISLNSSLTIIMIIHDISLASEYCNHIIMMKDGRIFEQGTPNDIITKENIKSLYDMDVVVEKNPISEKPLIYPTMQYKSECKML